MLIFKYDTGYNAPLVSIWNVEKKFLDLVLKSQFHLIAAGSFSTILISSVLKSNLINVANCADCLLIIWQRLRVTLHADLSSTDDFTAAGMIWCLFNFCNHLLENFYQDDHDKC